MSTVLGILGGIGAILIVPAIIFFAAVGGKYGSLSALRVFLDICAAILTIVAFSLPIALPVALIAWIYVRLDGNAKTDRERLIKAADKLRAKQADARDEDANRAK